MSDFSPPYENNSSTMEAAQPYNREAEEAVLGAVLVNPEVYYDVSQILHPEDFYIVRNRWVWEVFVDLHERRVPIDYLTVEKELETKGQLFEIGGAAYLTALITQTPRCTPLPTLKWSRKPRCGGACWLQPMTWRVWLSISTATSTP